MKWQWMVVAALAVATLGACGDDDAGGGADDPSAGGAYDKAAYCGLVQEAIDRDVPEPAGLDGEVTEESAKALEEAFSKELAFTEEVVAAAPEELTDEWQSVADVQAAVAEQGRKFLDPEFLADYRAKSEDERIEFFFTEVLGPFEDLDDKDLEAIGTHAESECGIEGLFDDA